MDAAPPTALPDGITFRTYRDAGDVRAMVAVRERCRERDQVDDLSTLDRTPTVEELSASLGAGRCQPKSDVLIVEASDTVVGYVRLAWWTENDGTQLYRHTGYLVPDWRGQGVGTQMLRWSQRRLREIARPRAAGGSMVFGSNATEAEVEKIHLLIDDGYTSTFTMVEMGFDPSRPLEAHALPDGFELRPVTAGDLRKIWEANNAVYAGREFVSPPTEADFREFVEDPDNDFSLWHVAWRDDEVGALVISEIKRGLGEVVEVSTVEAYRRRGLARALLTRSVGALQSRGVRVIRLHTNGENVAGAKSLYEQVGFRQLKSHIRFRKPFE
jgi:mycothiol synthase